MRLNARMRRLIPEAVISSCKMENYAAATALNYFAYNFIKILRTHRVSPAMAAGVSDRLWDVGNLVALLGSLRAAEGGKSGMIYVKCTLAGLLAVLGAAILLIIVVVVGISILSRSQSSQAGSVGWDPISLARPFTWLVVVVGIFMVGFFWEFFRLRSK